MSSVVFICPQNARKSLKAGNLPKTPLGELTALPRPITGFMGPTLRPSLLKGEKGREEKGEERGAKIIRAPGRQKPSRRHSSSISQFVVLAH